MPFSGIQFLAAPRLSVFDDPAGRCRYRPARPDTNPGPTSTNVARPRRPYTRRTPHIRVASQILTAADRLSEDLAEALAKIHNHDVD